MEKVKKANREYTKRIDIVWLELYSNLSCFVTNGKKGLINIYGISLGKKWTGELQQDV